MKKIIIFSLLYQFLFSIFSLLLIMIKEKFGSELFAYALYFNVFYFLIGFFINAVVTKILLEIKNINISRFFIYHFFISILSINIYVYFMSQKVLFFDIFDMKNDVWHISLSYHLSLLFSSVVMFFLSRKTISKFLAKKI